MENRINQVMNLENGKKLIILHQAIYNNENYYICAPLTDDGKDVKEDVMLYHEIKENDKVSIEPVTDPTLAEFILEHLNLIDKEEDK